MATVVEVRSKPKSKWRPQALDTVVCIFQILRNSYFLLLGLPFCMGYGPVEGKNVIQISRPYRKAHRRPELAQPLNTIIRF